MSIFDSTKKELEEEYIANSQMLSALEPIMHIHSCTVELYPDPVMDRKYDNIVKKLIDRIAQNNTIIMLQ